MGIVYQNRTEDFTIRVTCDNSYPSHIHRQVEIFYVLDGSIDITIGGRCMTLTKGMISVAFPNIIHHSHTPKDSLALLIIFDENFLPDFYHDFTTLLPKNPFVTDTTFTSQLEPVFQDLLASYEKAEDFRIQKGYLGILSARLLGQFELTAQNPAKSDICQDIANYLGVHFTEYTDLSILSAALGYSRYHISHIFKEKFGCSFTEYLGRFRAEYAMGLLTHSGCSITEACFSSGFNSMRTFYRVFETVYGEAPKKYLAKKTKEGLQR